MTPRTYERISTACLLLGIISALLFQHSGSLKWLVGSVGITAGLGAALVYFCNQWQDRSGGVDLGKKLGKENAESIVTLLEEKADTRGDLSSPYLHISAKPMSGIYASFDSNWLVLRETCETAGARESDAVVGRVVDIVQRLSAPENMRAFEFILSAEGNFTIRPLVHTIHPQVRRDLNTVEQLASEEGTVEQKVLRPN